MRTRYYMACGGRRRERSPFDILRAELVLSFPRPARRCAGGASVHIMITTTLLTPAAAARTERLRHVTVADDGPSHNLPELRVPQEPPRA